MAFAPQIRREKNTVETRGVSYERLSRARTVLRDAPDYADNVVNGAAAAAPLHCQPCAT